MRLPKTKDKILAILDKSHEPLDAIFLTKKINVNKTTIYRELENLLKENILVEVDFGDGKKRYELKKDHHHHVVCTTCGKIEDIEINEKKLLTDLQNKTKFLIQNHSIEFFGICKGCL